ncbi:hypothetical protein IPA_03785 [Ignicoccus pacificus DSM 13166]|uniref:GTP-dependent dephospho-CoA kinase n=1 Tax=Ignicoccus pacificus DSM 13166 TaxID=940294 RepID=A0A977PJY6_9CREN|nr:hypothetical protein IPA_03785 [Ignicoccus pacificus DSM 13166]
MRKQQSNGELGWSNNSDIGEVRAAGRAGVLEEAGKVRGRSGCIGVRFSQKTKLILASPRGVLFTEPELLYPILKHQRVISVGDVSTRSLLSKGIEPELAIFDGKTRRNLKVEIMYNKGILKVRNPPGYICVDSVMAIIRALSEGRWILVDGEEDLLALPALLAAPKGWSLIYGQPGAGIVYLEVNEYTKRHFLELLELGEGEGKRCIMELLEPYY